MLDIFNNNAFGVVSLTDAINKPLFAPGRLGQMGLFSERGVTTTTVRFRRRACPLLVAGQCLRQLRRCGARPAATAALRRTRVRL